jgi:hypothetical protein
VPDVATPTDTMAFTALACHQASVEIRHRLTELRRFLLSAQHRLAATPAEFQALITSFDIYTLMLEDTLKDMAAAPGHHHVSPPAGLDRAARFGNRPPGEHRELRTVLKDGATAIIGELHRLKRRLAPLQVAWCAADPDRFAGLKNEWDIAAEGLLGSSGVLGHLARTMDLEWTSHRAAMWGSAAHDSGYL